MNILQLPKNKEYVLKHKKNNLYIGLNDIHTPTAKKDYAKVFTWYSLIAWASNRNSVVVNQFEVIQI